MKKLLFILLLCIVADFSNAQTATLGLNVNDHAPDFTAYDQNGKKINLNEQLKKGDVVLIFYRGQWCPYCNKQLMQLQDSLSMITAKGATVIAVTPEQKENVSKTIEKTKAMFSILTDDNLKILTSYKVAFELDSATTEKYKGYGIDLNESNGNNGNHLPVPAVYIINKDGKITYRFFDTDYKKRASVKEILSHL